MATVFRRILTILVFLSGLLWVLAAGLSRDYHPAANSPPKPPTHPVTIQDVLEANIPNPTRSRVSFPKFSYKQAEPNATDAPEIVITKFGEAPMLGYIREGTRPAGATEEDLSRWQDWRQFYPKDLPPVEDRLPRNPAVVVGPDSPGQYGGQWRRCATDTWDFTHKFCYESFMRYDPSGRLSPCLAYKWEVAPGNRVYTLYLRKGHRWSDGHPYTTEDVLWACNIFRSDPPDWMMATDGTLLLYGTDVRDWGALARRLIQEAGQAPSVGAQVKRLGSERLLRNLQALAAGDSNDPEAPALAAADLNDLFRLREFYSPRAFRGVDPNAEINELAAAGLSRLDGNDQERMLHYLERADFLARVARDPNALDQTQVSRLNLSMFRSAYRDLVAPPVKQCVKVEAVADETGDASHIVRFTFPRPNSLFLEHVPTFMFYRIFAGSKHGAAPFHPDGSSVLAASDVYEWEALFGTILQQAASDAPSPGRQLWNGLDDGLRKRIQASPPKDDSPEEYKSEVVEGINQVLRGRRFYDGNAWKGFDASALRRRLCWNEDQKRQMGLAEVFRDSGAMLEYRDLLVLEDLQRRFEREGAASLSDADHLRLNVAMFRAAFSADARKPLAARTRTAGLNRSAEKHPLRYTSWQARFNDRGNYHPKYSPHEPVLGAWRLVSEKDAPERLAVRNPYYYRVDGQGSQLPYIDSVRTTISSQKEIRILKLTSGNVDALWRGITFDEFTVLKQSEEKGDYKVLLWANDYCGEVTFETLQARRDPMFLKLNEDPNFRHALSSALNRQEMIDVVFAGMGTPAQFAVPPGSPYFSEKMWTTSVAYDPNRANRLLDAMGLDKRAADGTRLFWNGQPIILDVNIPDSGIPIPAARLACQYWQNIGINAQLKIRSGKMMYRLEEMGDSDLRVHKEGGNFFGPFPPGSYYCSHPAESTQWYQWANYLRSGGRMGWPAPERIRELDRMWDRLVHAPDREAKMAAWKAVTDRFADDLPIWAIMTSPGKVVYVKNGFKNVPTLALAGWIAHEPGNACPESFYFDRNYKKK